MNKKGQRVFFGFGIAVILYLALINILPILKEEVITARNGTNLNCTGTSITTGTRATCIMIDYAPFYFFVSGLAVLIGFLTWKQIKG